MANALRSQYTKAPKGGSPQWSDGNAGTVNTNEFFGAPSIGGNVKVWDGSAWVSRMAKVWDGSAWVAAVIKFWNGTAWQTTNY
jgi:hypothetical protein